MKLVSVTDAAFKRLDVTGLSCRGAVIALVSQSHIGHPGGDCIILDFASKKQKRVARSTFAAELHAMIDGFEVAKVISLALQEIICGPMSCAQLAKVEEDGQFSVPIHAAIDAFSVFTAIRKTSPTKPSEASLVILILALRESLEKGRLSAVWWVDTLSMLADGLTKGACPRKALLEAFCNGKWFLNLADPEKKPVKCVGAKT